MLSKRDIEKAKLEHERAKKLQKRKKGPKARRPTPGNSTQTTPAQQITQAGDKGSEHKFVFVVLSMML